MDDELVLGALAFDDLAAAIRSDTQRLRSTLDAIPEGTDLISLGWSAAAQRVLADQIDEYIAALSDLAGLARAVAERIDETGQPLGGPPG
jgi:hypothetical protein